MKILFIAPAPPPPGGIESVTESLLGYVRLHNTGYELIHYNTTHQFRPVTNESIAVRIFSGFQNALQTYFRIRSMMKSRPSLVHLASSASLSLFKDYLIVLAARRKKIPVVVHWHFGRIPAIQQQNNWEWKMLLRVVRLSSMTVVIDKRSYETLISAGIRKLVNIPNPLSAETEKMALALQAQHHKRVTNRLVFVGHIIKTKGVFELAEACAGLSVPPELLMIGPCESATRLALEKIASTKNDGNWLKFTGSLQLSEVLEHMKQAPILVLPSYTEGFPMVVIEAMAMGCAVIATDVGGIPEALAIGTDEPCGICVPAQQVPSLQNAIVELSGNPSAISTFSRRGLSRVLSHYTIEKVEMQYRENWRQTLAGKSA